LSALRQAALEQLLLVESQVARFVRTKMQPGAAPEPSVIPNQYPVFVPGRSERPRQKKLDLWDRFHVADGLVPTLARLTVACGIIAAVLSVGATVGSTIVNIYNGLGRPVTVDVGGTSTRLTPFSHAKLTVSDQEHYAIKTTADGGELIEQFEVDIPYGSHQSVYNIGGASMLVEWTATYGSVSAPAERVIGPVRWTTSQANFIFEEPPESISTSSHSEGGTRTVMGAFGHDNPGALSQIVDDQKQVEKIVAMHALWDPSDAGHTAAWLEAASHLPGFDETLRARLAMHPGDVLTLRAEQDYSGEDKHAEVCERHRSMAQGQPANIDLQYVAARCLETEQQRDQAFADLYAKAPEHGWLASAVAYTYMDQSRWQEAGDLFKVALKSMSSSMSEHVAIDSLRVRRLLSVDGNVPVAGLKNGSSTLQYLDAVETGAGLEAGNAKAYYHLGRGAPNLAAQEVVRAPEPDQRVIRLAAASDGAEPDVIKSALALPATEAIDDDTVLISLALALRERRNPEPYIAAFRESSAPNAQQVLDFISLVRQGGSEQEADRLLAGVDYRLRPRAYAAALVLLGKRAPEEWRKSVTRLLFVFERPYFDS
jgi:tetratricopeptide (TPR) repeat protein